MIWWPVSQFTTLKILTITVQGNVYSVAMDTVIVLMFEGCQ